MCENYFVFKPKYTITSEILKNIATIEYGKAIIESKTILSHWENQLQKEAKIQTIENILSAQKLTKDSVAIKKFIDGISSKTTQEIINLSKAISTIENGRKSEIDEIDVKNIHREITGVVLPETQRGRYRSIKIQGGSNPEEILANMVQLFDWYNSLDAKDDHPILSAGILQSELQTIKPFEKFNTPTAFLTTKLSLSGAGYSMNNVLNIEKSFEGQDLTGWLEIFTDYMARQVSNVKEKVNLLARDTKLAKAGGRIGLTDRQEKIVVYLQDYGILKNKDFGKLFPKISEDSVLRDLKTLISKNIVEKRGKTKSSRYELK